MSTVLCPAGVHEVDPEAPRGKGKPVCPACRRHAGRESWRAMTERRAYARRMAKVYEPLRPVGSEWRSRSKCLDRSKTDELFHPESPWCKELDYAKAICAGCPVRKQCLTDALSYSDTRGVRGGYLLPYEILDIP